jgi:hypothetical protein
MNQNKNHWSFVNKDQRKEAQFLKAAELRRHSLEQAAELDSRTHLEHEGRKGYLGFSRELPALMRHAGNLLYARWRRGKRLPYVLSAN